MADLIQIVDDEQDLVDTLTYNLQRNGYRTSAALTGSDALRQLESGPRPDLILLDLMLPDLPGMEICQIIRGDPKLQDLPILMLTARGEESDRINGLEAGADDYIVKPFSIRELILRIQVVLRRCPPGQSESRQIEFGCMVVDLDAYEVTVNDKPVNLSALEFRLLTNFLDNKGRAQSRSALLEKVWDIHADVQTRTVDVHVKRLRDKLMEAGEYIHTVRGFGYRFRKKPDEAAN
ncbi:MAG: response regulator transcription factor [Gammaproteobacteria bacterium]|nr:response regulator transcription factor [Gammaproteobacteria bacterium]